MPNPAVPERFVALVEANAHVEAIETFYATDASALAQAFPDFLPFAGDTRRSSPHLTVAKGGAESPSASAS
jgi:hypothetical protein